MENSPAHVAAAQLLSLDEFLGANDVGTDWEINFIIAQFEQWIENHQPRTASQLIRINEIYNQYMTDYPDDMVNYMDNLDDSKLDFITGVRKTI